MNIEIFEDFAKKLKTGNSNNTIKIFEDFAKKNKINKEELEELLSKKYDCFRCESCQSFYCYNEYSFFDEKCTYCLDTEEDYDIEEENEEEDYDIEEENEEN